MRGEASLTPRTPVAILLEEQVQFLPHAPQSEGNMNDSNTIETTEEALRAAISYSIEKRLDIALEKLAKIEGMLLGIQAVIVEWQAAYHEYKSGYHEDIGD